MSTCNFCTLSQIKNVAKSRDRHRRKKTGDKHKTRVVVVQRMDNSANVYTDGAFAAWFMGLPDHCVCYED